MQKTTGNRIRLGVFVTISIALFMAGIYFIGSRQQLFSSTFHISGIFRDIGGLQVGNNVRFSGINVGVISNIQQITDTTVQVDMSVNEHTRKFIKKNARAIIGSDGLMGNKIILIIPGVYCDTGIKNNDIIATTRPISIDDIMIKVKATSDNVAGITDDLAVIIHSIRLGKGTIGKLFVDTSLATTLDATMVNIKQGTKGFKQNMDAVGHNVLLRGYMKRKEKREKKKEEKKEAEQAADNSKK